MSKFGDEELSMYVLCRIRYIFSRHFMHHSVSGFHLVYFVSRSIVFTTVTVAVADRGYFASVYNVHARIVRFVGLGISFSSFIWISFFPVWQKPKYLQL